MKVERKNNKIYFNYFDRAYATISLDKNTQSISIDIIKVEPPFRRIGIASMIIKEILDYIRLFFSTFKEVILSPLPLDKDGAKLVHLINFYKKFGFRLTKTSDISQPYLMTKTL